MLVRRVLEHAQQPLRHILDVRVRCYRDPLDADQAEEIWNVLAQEYRQYPMGNAM